MLQAITALGLRTAAFRRPAHRRAVLALTLLALAGLVSACGDSGGDSAGGGGSTTQASGPDLGLRKDGVLTFGSSIAIAPFAFRDPSSGQPSGLDVDLAKALGRRLGVEVEFVDNPSFPALIPALQDGQYDAIIAAITIKPDRAEVIDFTEPYIDSDQALVVPAGSAVDGLDALGEDAIVGAQQNTTSSTYADEHVAPKVKEVRTYDGVPQALQDLSVGRLAAVVADIGAAGYAVAGEYEGELEIADSFPTGEQFGIGVRKGNAALLEALDRALADMRADGSYDAIVEKWLGELPK